MPKFMTSVRKVRDKHVIELPPKMAKALEHGTTVLVECIRVQPVDSRINGKMQRNREILQRSKNGMKADDISVIYNLTPQRVKEVIDEMEELERQGSVGLYISKRSMNIIKSALGLPNPTLEEFKKAIETNRNWKKWMLSVPGGGREVVREIRSFCKEHGISCS